MLFKASVAQVETDASGVTIRSFRGEKRIPYQNITSVQFRPAGLFTSGLIRFGVLGGNEAHRPLLEVNDENAVVFGRRKQQEALKLRALVEEAVAKARASSNADQVKGLIADELTKLADLRDRGALTDDEFDSHKARLLSR